MQTAEEFLKGKPFSIESIHKYMIEFAKLHCIEQAKVISEKAEINCNCDGDEWCRGEIDKNSILNAYSLDLIK